MSLSVPLWRNNPGGTPLVRANRKNFLAKTSTKITQQPLNCVHIDSLRHSSLLKSPRCCTAMPRKKALTDDGWRACRS